MHRFSLRSDENADLCALRHARRKAPANVLSEYVEEAGGTRLRVGGTRFLRVAPAVQHAG